MKPIKRKRASSVTSAGQSPSPKVARDANWYSEPGTLLQVNLINFMCHSKLQFTPGQRLNFLCGVNGSGKSAVMAAITFGLGGSAKTAKRGNSNCKLIKNGQNMAKVEIHLSNSNLGYRHDLYGDVIIIEKSVYSTGRTHLVMKSSKGQAISKGKPTEELKRICSALDIQVDNPVALLNQETAKTFLVNYNPNKLYDFFMKATQLEALSLELERIQEEIGLAYENIIAKEENLPYLQEERNRWKKKLESLQSNLDKRKQVLKKKDELVWAIIKRGEKILETCKTDSSKKKTKLDKCNDILQGEEDKKENLENQKKEMNDQIEILIKEFDEESDMIATLKNDAIVAKEALLEVTRKVKAKSFEADKTESEKRILEVTIDKYRREIEDESAKQERLEKLSRIEDLEASIKKKEDLFNTKTTHAANISASIDSIRHEKYEEKSKQTNLSKSIQQKTNQIRQVEKQKDNKLVLFGEKMPRLVKEIQQASSRFSKMPLGPIGAEIEVAHGVTGDLLNLLEMGLRNVISTFIVDNFDDKRVLEKLQTKCGTRFSIVTAKFIDNKYDVSKGKCEMNKYPTILDLLVIKNPNVYNCLVNQKHIEQILILPDEEVVQNLLSSVHSVPKNCAYAYVNDSGKFSQYYPAPDYRNYGLGHSDNNMAKILKPDVKGLILSLEREVNELRNDLEIINEHLAELDQNAKSFQREKEEHDATVKKTREAIKADKILLQNLSREVKQSDSSAVESFEEDLDCKIEELENIRKNLEELEKEKDTKSEIFNLAKDKVNERKASCNSHEETIQKLRLQLESIDKDLRKVELDYSYYQKKKAEYNTSWEGAASEVKRREQELENMVQKAKSKNLERIETQRTPESLREEIGRLEEMLKIKEGIAEPLSLVTKKLQQFNDQYNNSKESCKELKSQVEKLTKLLTKRERGYREIRQMFGSIVKNKFCIYLASRHFEGNLTFDHSTRTLEIDVIPDGSIGVETSRRSMKSLSGGEKSYSTISLILSLWSVMNPPFRMLDEFDVFMDMVNRRIALQQIIDYAQYAKKYQYVFLTPLNVDGIELNDNIKLTKLEKA